MSLIIELYTSLQVGVLRSPSYDIGVCFQDNTRRLEILFLHCCQFCLLLYLLVIIRSFPLEYTDELGSDCVILRPQNGKLRLLNTTSWAWFWKSTVNTSHISFNAQNLAVSVPGSKEIHKIFADPRVIFRKWK